MVGQAFSIDVNKPLAFQVGHLGEAYDEWVHQPIVTKGSPRFFENKFIELFTRTRWWEVPLFWLPIVWLFVSYPTESGVPRNHVATIVVGGVFLWTLMEYFLHRFILHIKTTGYWGNTFHYILHGCHHKHPMDDLRLVLPPPAAAVFIVFFWNLTKLVVPAPHSCALMGGELLGYVIYDCTHYYLHRGKPSHQLKKYHMNHHFRDQDKGFGVTTVFWDVVFGTLPSDLDKGKRQNL
ncbi:fatty acid hydroxylase 1 [Perilla frutescens var. frutescens]|nr:fatty acid hydroxylase 1 [Perilla frutescens var. frutescens]